MKNLLKLTLLISILIAANTASAAFSCKAFINGIVSFSQKKTNNESLQKITLSPAEHNTQIHILLPANLKLPEYYSVASERLYTYPTASGSFQPAFLKFFADGTSKTKTSNEISSMAEKISELDPRIKIIVEKKQKVTLTPTEYNTQIHILLPNGFELPVYYSIVSGRLYSSPANPGTYRPAYLNFFSNGSSKTKTSDELYSLAEKISELDPRIEVIIEDQI